MGGTFEDSPTGVPLSPLLGNVMLNECDQELERRGHRFLPYADHIMIFCGSQRAAQRTLSNILPFIEKKLFLKVNREKTQVVYVGNVKCLGYGFYVYKGEARLRVHLKSIQKLKDNIREVTGRKTKLNEITIGWIDYFKLAYMKKLLKTLDEWTRSRIRMVTWKRWKRIRIRYENLKRNGIDDESAWMWANTRKGYWRTAYSPILLRAISNDHFKRAGYLSFVECYSAK